MYLCPLSLIKITGLHSSPGKDRVWISALFTQNILKKSSIYYEAPIPLELVGPVLSEDIDSASLLIQLPLNDNMFLQIMVFPHCGGRVVFKVGCSLQKFESNVESRIFNT